MELIHKQKLDNSKVSLSQSQDTSNNQNAFNNPLKT